MTRLLLDTHVFLWWLDDSPRLNVAARAAITNPLALVHVSAVCIWEIAIKVQIGKVHPGTAHPENEIEANHFHELKISARHAARAGALPLHHDDPFDRMLIAQAIAEGLTVVTHDKRFANYKVPVLWT